MIFLTCLLSVLDVQHLYGWQSIDLSAGNDYSTDAIKPPQFNQSKNDRLHSHQIPSLWRFLDIPHKVLKSDTGSLVLPMSGLDSKILIKQTLNNLGWVFLRRSYDSSNDKVFNETCIAKAGITGIQRHTDLAVRVTSDNRGVSTVDVRASSPYRRRDLGFNNLVIRKLAKAQRELDAL